MQKHFFEGLKKPFSEQISDILSSGSSDAATVACLHINEPKETRERLLGVHFVNILYGLQLILLITRTEKRLTSLQLSAHLWSPANLWLRLLPLSRKRSEGFLEPFH